MRCMYHKPIRGRSEYYVTRVVISVPSVKACLKGVFYV